MPRLSRIGMMLMPYWKSVYRPVNLATTARTPVTVTASATQHTKGAWVELIASTDSVVTLALIKTVCSALSLNSATLLDIGVGAAASETVIIPDVQVGGTPAFNTSMGIAPFVVPVFIPKGSRISARIQSVIASQSAGVGIDLFHTRTPLNNDGPPASYSPTVTTYGANTATSLGTVIAPHASLNTKSAWTEIVAATTAPATFLGCSFGRGGANNTSPIANMLVDVGMGSAGTEIVLASNIYMEMTQSETLFYEPVFVSGLEIPSGTRLVARYQRSGTNGLLDCCMHTNWGKVIA